MQVLITGAGGFVGSQLIRHLIDTHPTIEIHGTILEAHHANPELPVTYHTLNLCDDVAVVSLIDSVQPQYIYHLAAQAFVPRSFEAPWETLENNILSELNIFLACIELNIRPRILIISSAEIYGAIRPDELPIDEHTPMRPANPYSVSKVAQDMLALQYHLSHNLPILRARPFNHIGPGQNARFVAPAFAIQIAQIEQGLQDPIMRVGNLSAKRDFTDVRDIVCAYRTINEKGIPGRAYNVASGQARSIQFLLDTLLSFTDVEVQVTVDPHRLRPVDVPIVEGDATLLCEETGWETRIDFEQTLKDVLDDCRQRVTATQKE